MSARPRLDAVVESGRLKGSNRQMVARLVNGVDALALDRDDRRDLLSMLGVLAPEKAARPSTGCGTAQGWRQHKSSETQPCQPCLDAWADYHRERGARGDE